MKVSVWYTPADEYAVCDGAGPTGVIGYVKLIDGAWVIDKDPTRGRFISMWDAVRSLSRTENEQPQYHLLARGKELQTVIATPDVLDDIMTEGGWVLVASGKDTGDIERKKAQAFPKPEWY